MNSGPPLPRLPDPPYYAAIFTSVRTGEVDGYDETARRMVELAGQQPGFLGVESVRDGAVGITISYWSSEAAIARWKADLEHRVAQRNGRAKWYIRYTVRIARVERAHGFDSDVREAV